MSTISTPIRTGIIGFGTAGRIFHAPPIAANHEYRIDAIVTGNTERADQARQQYPGARIVDDVERLWSLGLDLLIIGTPPASHVWLATQALDHDIAVVVDKPFVISQAEGTALINHAEGRDVPLTVFQNRRWDADFLTLRQLIDDGKLGRIHRFESRFERWTPQVGRSRKIAVPVKEGGGVLYDFGPHLIDQAVQLFGPVSETYAEVITRRESGAAPDDVFVALEHQSGTRSHLWMNSLVPRNAPRFHVVGSKAGYTKWGLDSQEDYIKGGGTVTDADYGLEPPAGWGMLGIGAAEERIEPGRGGYPRFYELLADALLRGGPMPVDPRDATEVMGIIERIHGDNLS